MNNEFQRHQERYIVDLSIQVQVPADFARSVLRDPDRVQAFHPDIISVKHLPSKEPGIRRFVDTTETCVFVFCFKYQNTMRISDGPEGEVMLEVEPDASDFHFGRIIWVVEAYDRETSRLSFHAELEPNFWVPSMLGESSMQRHIHDTIYEVARHMECDYRNQPDCEIFPEYNSDDDEAI